MIRNYFPLVVVLALACGGQEAQRESMEPTDVSAASVEEDVVEEVDVVEEQAPPPDRGDASGCLTLVAQGNFADAVVVCAEASQLDPDNAELQQALLTAKQKSMAEGGDVSRCLALVENGKFQDAIAVCAEAAELNPDNLQVQQALAKAQQEATQGAAKKMLGH